MRKVVAAGLIGAAIGYSAPIVAIFVLSWAGMAGLSLEADELRNWAMLLYSQPVAVAGTAVGGLIGIAWGLYRRHRTSRSA